MTRPRTSWPAAGDAERDSAPLAGPRRRLASFRYAGAGIAHAWRTQPNLRIQLALGLVAVALGLWLGLPARDFAVLAVAATLVLVLELLNTVVEAAIDLASPDPHPLAGVAKDVAAGAVLLAAIGALAVGALLFLPRLLPLPVG